jgi:peptidoglycan hydrolase-like protein with peptidoglycan-binding domain
LGFIQFGALNAPYFQESKMKKLPWVVLCLFLLFSVLGIAQNSNSSTNSNKNTNASKTKNTNAHRGPVFRATKDQVNQAQALLKQRNFYSGEPTGKLDDATRAGLKQYQQAEGLKVTGTLNKMTLEKMGITLTDKQKTM